MSRALLEFVSSRAAVNQGTELDHVYYRRLLRAMQETVRDYERALGDTEELPPEPAGLSSCAGTLARAEALELVCKRLAAVFRDDREFNPEWAS